MKCVDVTNEGRWEGELCLSHDVNSLRTARTIQKEGPRCLGTPQAHAYSRTHTCTCAPAHTCLCTQTSAYADTCTLPYRHTRTQCTLRHMYTCSHSCTHPHMHIKLSLKDCLPSVSSPGLTMPRSHHFKPGLRLVGWSWTAALGGICGVIFHDPEGFSHCGWAGKAVTCRQDGGWGGKGSPSSPRNSALWQWWPQAGSLQQRVCP